MAGPSDSDDPFGLSGQTIEGKYEIASVIGDGGFGVVYRAVHKGFGELIAVKCLKMPAVLDAPQREALLETLREEGRILHRLSRATSGIVQALDVGAFVTSAGVWVPYLVLEWLEGETLAQHLRARRDRGEEGMTIDEAIRLLDPAARALAVAHAQRVAHRDVKPANLFLAEVGGARSPGGAEADPQASRQRARSSIRTLKVLDFGIAKVLANHPTFTEALAATKQGPSAFTPRYGAPEQFNKARGATGPWTDVFALALIFVELVSGKKALEGDDPTQLYIASADPAVRPTLRSRGFDAGDAIERVLDKALSIEPKYRYASAGEFWDALVAAARGASAAGVHDGGGGAVDRDGSLSTAEFAAAKRLDISADAGGRPLDATELASSQEPAPARPAVIKVSGDGASSHLGTSGSAATGRRAPPAQGAQPDPRSASYRMPVEDSMIETIAPARGSGGGAGGGSGGAHAGGSGVARAGGSGGAHAGGSGDARAGGSGDARAGAPTSGERPRRGGARLIVVSLLAAAVLGGGAAAYFFAFAPPAKPTRAPGKSAGAPARSAPAAGVPKASAAPSASAPPPSSASASASPAPPPPDMVYIAPLTAKIGAGIETREVTLTRGFFIDRNEVTVRAYRACMEQRICSAADHVSLTPERPPGDQAAETPPTTPDPGDLEGWSRRCNEPRNATTHPVNCVDYGSAEGYCRFRGRRLPTEAEWELAARGAEGRAYPWGDEEPTCDRACFDKNEACLARGADVATCPAGSHPKDRTPDGIYDLAGGVSEWVSDGFVFPPPGGVNPQGDPAALLKVVRGASFLDSADKLSATYRAAAAPVTAHVSIGFRCAMDVPPADGEAAPAP